MADACICADANFGNNAALNAVAAVTGTASPAVNGAVVAFAAIAGVAVLGGAAFFIVRHLRAAAAASAGAMAAKATLPVSGGESGVLPPMQPFFTRNPLAPSPKPLCTNDDIEVHDLA